MTNLYKRSSDFLAEFFLAYCTVTVTVAVVRPN